MNSSRNQESQTTDLKSLNLISWRIQRSRSENRQNEVHRQLMARLHENKQALN